MLTPKKGPSVARMVKFLGVTKEQATELKELMNEGYVHRTLNLADKMLDGCGREYLEPSDGGNGVDYVNMGETYATTFMFDFAKDKFIVGSWGDLVETQPRRFAY
jgi:hypothetical protein